MELRGIDVAKYQGNIDWAKVKKSGKEFAFIRIGWAGFDGAIVANGGIDSMFHTNVKAAIAAGINVGIYVYSYCKTAQAARTAARETLSLVAPYKLTYPIAFDIESISQTEPGGACYNLMSKAENTDIASAFLQEIQKAKYYGLLYTYKSFAESYLDMSKLTAYDVWIAQYATKCTYAGNYGIWQHAGDAGRCEGVNTACDLNVAYKDYAAIIKAAGLNGFSTTEPALDEVTALRNRVSFLEDKLKAVYDLVEKEFS